MGQWWEGVSEDGSGHVLGWTRDGWIHKGKDGYRGERGDGEVDVSWDGQMMGGSTRKGWLEKLGDGETSMCWDG